MGWCVYSIYVIYGLVFGSLAIGIGTVLGEEALAIIDTIFNNFGILGSLLLLWSSFALAVKRLHDRDNPAWWLLIGFVPEAVLRTVIESLYQINTPQILRGTISLGVVALIWVVLGCLKGNRGPNRFGPDPLKTENTHFKGD